MLVCLGRETSASGGLRHDFACCYEGRFAGELRQAGATVHRLPSPRLSRPWEVLRARAALRRHLRQALPAVVVTHSSWVRLVFGRSLVPARGPTVAWVHTASTPPSLMDRWGQRPAPRLVILNSRHTLDRCGALFPGSPREILYSPVPPPPPIDPTSRRRLRDSLRAPPDHAVILIAARLEPWKGHEALLDGLARLPASCRWMSWIAAGPQNPAQTTYLPTLRERARQRGIADRVAFLGERKDVSELLDAADVYCQPNLEPEPFGVVFVEALYAGRPVLATAIGGAREIVTESCGRLVAPGDIPGLSSALAELIERPASRARLGAGGPARAAELCDPRRQTRALEDLLSAL